MTERLDDTVALVTGASSGIGEATARSLAARGAKVAVAARRLERLERLAAEIGGDGHTALAIESDITDQAQAVNAVDRTVDQLGRLDILVNNAGVLKFARITDMPLADFRRILEVNAVGCWLGMKAVIPALKAAGGGSIVNISSVEGFTGAAGLSAYSASKFAIRGMTKAVARELGEYKIRVNSVHPGGVLTRMVLDTDGTNYSGDDDGTGFLKAMPLARFAEPAEISRLVAFLASDDSSYSTGSEFIADGGLLSGPGY